MQQLRVSVTSLTLKQMLVLLCVPTRTQLNATEICLKPQDYRSKRYQKRRMGYERSIDHAKHELWNIIYRQLNTLKSWCNSSETVEQATPALRAGVIGGRD